MPSLIEAAQARLFGRVLRTPLLLSHTLSERTGARVLLKLENLQRTGSFKFRGATNRLLLLDERERKQGFVAASSGNHGIALATAAHDLSIDGLVVLPKGASTQKADRLKSLGVDVHWHGDDCVIAEAHGRELAAEMGRTFVSPYNDPDVMAGQGTLALEVLETEPSIDKAYVTVGGGGLIGGVGTALRHHCPDVEIIGCQPEASAVMAHSIERGEILDMESAPTLSDGSAGGLEPGSITFPLCRDLISEFQLVTEVEIARSIQHMVTWEKLVVEGAAAVAVAAFLKQHGQERTLSGSTVLIVICGGNISAETLSEAMIS